MDDTAFRALADEDRRQLLSMLSASREGDPPVRVPGDVITGSSSARELSTQLHHVHLPKLASMDYVEWDPESGAVRRGTAFEELEPLLSVLHEHEGKASD